MPELTLLTAFLAGLLGSTHCLSMCGGIATAFGSVAERNRRWHPLLYHAGRLTSYAIAGAAVGALGAAGGFAFEVSRWSEVLRLVTAVLVIVIGLNISLGAGARTRWLRAPERWAGQLWRRLLPFVQRRLPASPAPRSLVAGLMWGWLPCGLVYSVLVTAAAAGGPASGALTMLAFGLGTVPMLTGLTYAGAHLPRPGGTVARLTGSVLVACGLWTAITPIAVLTGGHAHHQLSRE